MNEVRKVIIIGSGPAGYAAALYTARAQLAPLVFAGETAGGQLMLTTEVENYPGFPKGVMGPDLMVAMREQAAKFGAEIVDKNVTRVDFSKRPFEIGIGQSVQGEDVLFGARAVIIATGAEAQLLGIPGERELMGRGVSTCAVCDAPFYKDKTTFVVGGGDAAMEEALALVKFAKSVTIIHRRGEFRASKIMQDRVLVDHKETVTVWRNSEVVKIEGSGKVERIFVKNTNSGEEREVAADGIFISIGHKPATNVFQGQVALDEKKYVLTGLTGSLEEGPSTAQNITSSGRAQDDAAGLKSLPAASAKRLHDMWVRGYPTMTNINGVFAAGDVVDFRYRQAVTAAGMGTQAALDVEWWLEREQRIKI